MEDEKTDATPKLGDNSVARITALAKRQMEAEARVARLKDELEAAEKDLFLIAERDLPNLMDELGVTEFKMASGVKVVVTESVHASITKERAAEAYGWLDENGHSDLVKREIVIRFNRDEEAWARKFLRDLNQRKRPVNFTEKKSVHTETLKKFVREGLEGGEDIPLDVFGVFRRKATKVEVPAAAPTKARGKDNERPPI